jgi:flagellar L-ring protein precursor FlgH
MAQGIKKSILVVFMAAAAGVFQACAINPKQAEIDTIEANQMHRLMETVPQQATAAEGSLWRDGAPVLYVDARARNVGDTITVDIMESSSSSMAANTSADRTSSIDGGVDNALGLMRSLEAEHSRLGTDRSGTRSGTLFKADLTNSQAGAGSSDRRGSITASIGARVVEVYPNGNLVIFGRQEMKVNNDVQYIIVSGVVRPEDVDSDNTIISANLADAHIEYVGRGTIADKQKAGWGTRLVDKVWPF